MPAEPPRLSSSSRIIRSLDTLASVVTGIAAAALLGLVLVQGWQVFARYVMNDSPSWTEPVTLLLLCTAMSMGAAAGVHENRHFGFFLLAEKLRPGPRRAIGVISLLIMVAIGSALAYWGMVLLLDGLHVSMAGARMPQSIGYLPLSLGGGLMALFALQRLLAPAASTSAVAPAQGAE